MAHIAYTVSFAYPIKSRVRLVQDRKENPQVWVVLEHRAHFTGAGIGKEYKLSTVWHDERRGPQPSLAFASEMELILVEEALA